jgi:fatty-acyl-CoA synthase
VAEAVVFGVSLESWIEAVAAAVLFREGEGATTDELIAFVRESLASFKCPKYIVEMDAYRRTRIARYSSGSCGTSTPTCPLT